MAVDPALRDCYFIPGDEGYLPGGIASFQTPAPAARVPRRGRPGSPRLMDLEGELLQTTEGSGAGGAGNAADRFQGYGYEEFDLLDAPNVEKREKPYVANRTFPTSTDSSTSSFNQEPSAAGAERTKGASADQDGDVEMNHRHEEKHIKRIDTGGNSTAKGGKEEEKGNARDAQSGETSIPDLPTDFKTVKDGLATKGKQ